MTGRLGRQEVTAARAPAAGVSRAPPNQAPMEATEELPAGRGTRRAPAPVLGRYRLGARLGSGGLRHGLRGARRAARPRGRRQGDPGGRRRRPSARRARRWPPRGSTTPGSSRSSTPARTARRATWSPSWCAGRTLDRLAADGELSDRDVLRVGLALADALEHAHGRGVIHRDVKPQNVIVPDRPRSARSAAKLTDFGVAHLAGDAPLTRTGDVVGTLAYMAPEQADGPAASTSAPTSTRSRSCSTRASRASTRCAPASPAATARRARHGRCRRCGASARTCPPELCAALDRALSPRPEDRGTLDELADELGGRADRRLRRGRHDPRAPARAPAHRCSCRRARGPRSPRAAAAAGARRGGRDARPRRARRPPLARGRRPPRRRGRRRCRASAGWRAVGRARASCSPARAGPAAPRSCCSRAPPVRAALVRGSRPRLVAARRRAAAGPGRRWPAPTRRSPAAPAAGGSAPRSAPRACGGCCWPSRCSAARCCSAPPDAAAGWAADAGAALDGVLGPPLTSGLVALAAVWALAALVLPWLVRGRYAGARRRGRHRLGGRPGRRHRGASPSGRGAGASRAALVAGAVAAGAASRWPALLPRISWTHDRECDRPAHSEPR